MENGTIIAAVAGVLGMIGTGVGTYLKMRHSMQMELEAQLHKHQQEAGGAAVEQYREIAERLEKQIVRLVTDSTAKQKQLDDLVERDILCQVRLARQYGWLLRADGWMKQASERLDWLAGLAKSQGHDIGPMARPPEMPDGPPPFDDSPGFAARSSAQQTKAIVATNPIPAPLQRSDPP